MAFNVHNSNGELTLRPRDPSSIASGSAGQESPSTGRGSPGKTPLPQTRASTHGTLGGLQASPPDSLNQGDFLSSAAQVSAHHQKLDRDYAGLAGLPPVGPARIPRALAEQHALDALAQVIALMDGLAGDFEVPTATAMLSGKPENMAQLQLVIDRFLSQAQQTMAELVDKIGRELEAPPSSHLGQMLHFAKVDIWRGIEQMQKNIYQAFQTPVPGPAGPALPDSAQRSLICRHFREEQIQALQAQVSFIQLGRKKNPNFDASRLLGVVAMRAELQRARTLVEAQSKAAPDKSSCDASRCADESDLEAADVEENDGQEEDDGAKPDALRFVWPNIFSCALTLVQTGNRTMGTVKPHRPVYRTKAGWPHRRKNMRSITPTGSPSAPNACTHRALSPAPEQQADLRQFIHELQRMQAQLPGTDDSQADEGGEDEGMAPG